MKITNNFNLPESIVSAVASSTKPFHDKQISVTRLIDSPRIIRLMEENFDSLIEDVSDRLWVLLGQAVHEYLNKHTSEDNASETEVFIYVDDMMITGVPDVVVPTVINPETNRVEAAEIDDYKVTSAWSFLRGVKQEWENQLNTYAYILRRIGVNIEKIRIIAILRDWTATEARRNKDYPQSPFHITEVNLWTYEKQDEYVKQRVSIHKNARMVALNDVECTPEERWEKPTTWAVMKGDNKRAVRVFSTEKEAHDYVITEDVVGLKKFRVEERKGESVRCELYCPVREFCSKRVLSKKSEGEREAE